MNPTNPAPRPRSGRPPTGAPETTVLSLRVPKRVRKHWATLSDTDRRYVRDELERMVMSILPT